MAVRVLASDRCQGCPEPVGSVLACMVLFHDATEEVEVQYCEQCREYARMNWGGVIRRIRIKDE